MSSTDEIIFVMVGALFFLGSLMGTFKQLSFIKKAKKVSGVISVVGESISYSADGDTYRKMIISFSHNGCEHSFSTTVMSFTKIYVGKQVPVFFNEHEPSEAYVGTISQMFFFEIIIGLIGVLIMLTFVGEL